MHLADTLIGFTDMGDINNHLVAYEKCLEEDTTHHSIPLATSVLVLMVKGLFSSLKFLYAQFPCSAVTGGDLYSILWEAVGRLELMGFRVLGVTCDGLAANRKLYRLHSTVTGLVYKTQNPYARINGLSSSSLIHPTSSRQSETPGPVQRDVSGSVTLTVHNTDFRAH